MKMKFILTTLIIISLSNSKAQNCTHGDCSNGYGVFVWPTGEKYEGYWKNQVRDGLGTNYFTSGAVYSGEWKEDKLDGFGYYQYSNGDKYIGRFESNKKSGNGIYFFKDGSRYSGEWLEDMFHGNGTMIMKDSSVKSGRWEKNELVEVYADTNAQKLNPSVTRIITSNIEKQKVLVVAKSNPYYAVFEFPKEMDLRTRVKSAGGAVLGTVTLKTDNVVILKGGGSFTLEVWSASGYGTWKLFLLTEEEFARYKK